MKGPLCCIILQESPNILATIFSSPSSVHAQFCCAILVPLGNHLTGFLICLLPVDGCGSFKIHGILKGRGTLSWVSLHARYVLQNSHWGMAFDVSDPLLWVPV